ncbi:MAG: DUF4147 domain-containing protein [Phycisphaerales bacterium]|nr:DUF4147 domain-containing protein [Phycisphaerales bacterium]
MPEPAADIPAIIDAAIAGSAPGRALVPAIGKDTMSPLREAAVLAVGKGASGMMRAWLDDLGFRPERALMIHPRMTANPALSAHAGLTLLESDHPLPTERSLAAGYAAMELASACAREQRPLVALLSGGASALMSLPHPGLTIAEISACTGDLLRAGATIREINTVRAHCDQVKAGGLALAAAPAPVHAYIVSDVIGDHLPSIGSGPTVAPDSTASGALEVLREYRLDRTHKAIAAHLRIGSLSAQVGDSEAFSHVRATIIANNATAVAAAADRARSLGYVVAPTRSDVIGEARDVAFDFVSAVRRARARAGDQPSALIWGGETTVTVRGAGRGGRNQEAALAAAIAIDGDDSLTIAAFATDGVDGPTDAAGAVVTGRTTSEARRAGHDPEEYLRNNDAHGFFARVGGQMRPGPTGTNVNDVWIGLAH